MALRHALLFALFAFAAVFAQDPEIKFDESDGDKVVLLNFGDAACSVSVLYKGPSADAEVSTSDLFEVGAVEVTKAEDGYSNYTFPFTFDKDVGVEEYDITIGTASITGKVTVAGFTIKSGDEIVSGDNREGVTVGQEGTTTYDVTVVGVDGTTTDISGTALSFKEMSGPYMKEVDESKTSITSTVFTLAISQYRVGTGSFMINFESEDIVYQGESFETVLNVKQETTPIPPCVAIAGDYKADGGFVRIPFFNLLTPPQASPIQTVEITVGTETVTWDSSESQLVLPDQVAAFKISGAGKASFKCDGADAVILGGDVDVTGDSPPLATSLISTLPASDDLAVFESRVSFKNSDPSTLSRSDGMGLKNELCSLLGRPDTQCVIAAVTKGSAIVDFEALIEEDTAEDNKKKAEDAFAAPDCPIPTTLGYACDEMEFISSTVSPPVNAVGGVGAAGAGLATWTIVLIACVGAFALILVIVLGLWAVYRRSAEQSESDYSSSGPLGVPDPSDLLYEQSIVRDIYGRGDFPDGGPSQAVAEQRAREADLREEFPRPPSSSGISRGAATDDASSTYSV